MGSEWQTRPWSRYFLYLVCAGVFAYLIFPVLVIVPVSFSSAAGIQFPPPGLSLRWYHAYFTDGSWLDATVMSVKVALLASALSTVLGTMAAFGLVRGRYPFKAFLQAFIVSPIIIPVIILAIAIYRLYSALGLLGSVIGVALAHTVLAAPFVVMTVSATLARFDERLEQAAMGLGAPPLQTFLRVTLPLIRPGVLTGALFAFSTSFDEVVIAFFVGSTTAQTLPKKMWESLRTGIDPTISAASVLLITLTLLVLAGVEIVQRRGRRVVGEEVQT